MHRQHSPARPPHSGTRYAWLDGYGTTHTDTLQPVGDDPGRLRQLHALASGCTSTRPRPPPRPSSTSSPCRLGATTLATYSNLNKATGYTLKSFNVAAFAGQTVTLQFTGTEDSSLQTSFVIDDTALTVS